jgi:hypothetical protein
MTYQHSSKRFPRRLQILGLVLGSLILVCSTDRAAAESCLTRGDEAAIRALVDVFVEEIVNDLWPDVVPDLCAATKLTATGKLAADKLACYAKAVKKGRLVDDACLSQAEDRFSASFAKADAQQACLITGDAAAIGTKVDTFIADVVTQLLPNYPVISNCAASKLTTAGKLVADKLDCYAKAAKKGISVADACLSQAEAKFSTSFRKSEAITSTIKFFLDVSVKGSGEGTVKSAGINCKKSLTASNRVCSRSFEAGTEVTLTPIPDEGSVFVGWDGACMGTGACQLTMDEAHSVGATFDVGDNFTGSFDASGTQQRTLPQGTCTWATTWGGGVELPLSQTQHSGTARFTGTLEAIGSSSNPSQLTCLSGTQEVNVNMPASESESNVTGTIISGDFTLGVQATRSGDSINGTFRADSRPPFSGSQSGPISLLRETSLALGASNTLQSDQTLDDADSGIFLGEQGAGTVVVAPPLLGD